MSDIILTPRAAQRIQRDHGRGAARLAAPHQRERRRLLRLSYAFDIARDRQEQDIAIERDGATVIVDPVSVQYMAGSTIDFVSDLFGQSFKIENPLATASCGCGTSFSL